MNVHVFLDEKFVGKYVEFINANFRCRNHLFLILCSGKNLRFPGTYSDANNVVIIHKNIRGLLDFARYIVSGKKIIFHGVFNKAVTFLLGFNSIARKTYVALWGGDIYEYDKAPQYWNRIKHRLLSRCAGITCELEEDYHLACELYKTNVQYFESMLYLSNIVDGIDYDVTEERKRNDKIWVLVGNSADPENNHFYLLEKLLPYAKYIKLIVPLSYGNQSYADKVELFVKNNYGCDSCVLRKFLPIEEYKLILKSIDVAVFAHNRQQALGNTFQLLSYGAKVFLKGNTTTYKWMKRKGICVFDVDDSRCFRTELLQPMLSSSAKENKTLVCELASERRLYDSWKRIFDD